MKDPGIVRNRLKIEAAIGNARAYLEFQCKRGGFARHLWSFVGGKPIQNRLHAAEAGAGHQRRSPMRSARI